MRFMAQWEIRPEVRDQVIGRFLKGQASPPPGVRIIGRWHRADGRGGWVVVQCDNTAAGSHFVRQWSDLMPIEITPVLDDNEVTTMVRALMVEPRPLLAEPG